MNLTEITPLVLTWNESPNIERTLRPLKWAQRIVVVDSHSTDATAEIARRFENVKVLSRTFDNHTAQWNYGLDQIETPWVLALDADYDCPASLEQELLVLDASHNVYLARFQYCIHGQPLRGTLYPPRAVLFRADRFRYRQDGHTQTLDVSEAAGSLKSVIQHDDRKPLSQWLAAQSRYADLEVGKLLTGPAAELGWKDRLRKQIVWMPVLTLIYCLFYRCLILDGWPGIYYTLQRVYAELLLSLKLLDRKLRRS